MKFKNIPTEEKRKCMDKILKQIKDKVKYEDKTDDDLYQECKIAGFMIYEFLRDYVNE